MAVTARQPHVVVVGSYAVGLVMRTERIPRRGETVLGHSFQRMDGGKGSNQAIACARLGAHTTFLAALGDDQDGAAALRLLAAEGVETSQVRRIPGVPTGVGFITVDDSGDNAIAVDLGANRLLSTADIDSAEALIAGADLVLAQLEIAPRTALHALGLARKHGVRTILNPAPAQPLAEVDLQMVDILTPNLSEAQLLTGLSTEAIPDLGAALRRSDVGTAVITVGEEGAWIVNERQTLHVPAYAVQAVDTTGAGDAFSAALAVALAEGAALEAAVRFACAAGAYCVQAMGTVPSYARRHELTQFRREQQ